MSTRVCPACGAQYLGWVNRCADCGVGLTDSGPSVLDLPEDDQLVYELIEWTPERRRILSGLLQDEGVGFAWEGTDLIVHVDDEARVDDMVEAIEAVEPGGLKTAKTAEEVGLSGDQLVYDLSEWDEGERALVTERLLAHGIAFVWDDASNLAVSAAAEDEVEAILDAVEDGELVDATNVPDDEGSDAAGEAMSELFLAADRLQHDPADVDALAGFMTAAEEAAEAGTPYGLEPKMWKAVLDQSDAIQDLVVAEETDEDAIAQGAATLRGLLRPYI